MLESCDTNLLFHAVNPSDALHLPAARYLQSKQSDETFVLCELALAELYGLLRNPRINVRPLNASDAVATIQELRHHPYWRILDYPGNLMDQVWEAAARPDFPRTSIYDARLALTLRHFGVTHFATRNVKHFANYGFDRVFDPTT